MLLCMYFRRDTSCFLSELDNKEILVLQGERFGRIAFANPDILDKDKWVVVNARKKKLYTEDEAREILTSKNQSK